MSTKKKTAPKKKSTRVPAKDKVQPPIPGAEQSDKNPRIHNAAIQYAEYRDARMEQGREEKKAEQNLIEVMIEEGVEHYEHGNVRADLNRDSVVKVKIKSEVPDETSK